MFPDFDITWLVDQYFEMYEDPEEAGDEDIPY